MHIKFSPFPGQWLVKQYLSICTQVVGEFIMGLLTHPYPYLDWGAICVPFYWVGSIRPCGTPALHAYLSCGSTPARPHSVTSVFTHSNHVFLGLPCFLVLGIGKLVIIIISCCHHRNYMEGNGNGMEWSIQHNMNLDFSCFSHWTRNKDTVCSFFFTPQPLRAPGYCRRPSGRAGGRADKPR